MRLSTGQLCRPCRDRSPLHGAVAGALVHPAQSLRPHGPSSPRGRTGAARTAAAGLWPGRFMMRGRKPVPTALHLVTGNQGKRPFNQHEPKPKVTVPACPAHLSPSAKAEWKRLDRPCTSWASPANWIGQPLRPTCQAYGRWVEGRAEAQGDPCPAENAGRLCAALALACHRQEEPRAHAQVHDRNSACPPVSRSRVFGAATDAQSLGGR